MLEERIKQRRIELGWSQAELARRMFVSQPSVAEWESGRKAPHLKNMARLAMLLGVSFDWLSTGRGDMLPPAGAMTRQESAEFDWLLPEERQLLSSYSRLKPAQRAALLGFLETL
jgi:transcriptional regulator with XRE-family HTH domain